VKVTIPYSVLANHLRATNRTRLCLGDLIQISALRERQLRMRHRLPGDQRNEPVEVPVYQATALVDLVKVGIGPPERDAAAALAEGLYEPFEVMGVPDVVLVQKRDQGASGARHAVIAGRRLAAVRLAQQSERPLSREPFDDRGAGTVVGRTVVYDNGSSPVLGR
jgi:hypothetical protein